MFDAQAEQAKAEAYAAELAAYKEATRSSTGWEHLGNAGINVVEAGLGLEKSLYGLANMFSVGYLDRGLGWSKNFDETSQVLESAKSDPLLRDKAKLRQTYQDNGTLAYLGNLLTSPSLMVDTALPTAIQMAVPVGIAGRAATLTADAAKGLSLGEAATQALIAKQTQKAVLAAAGGQAGGSANVDTVNAIRAHGGSDNLQQFGGLGAGLFTGIATPLISMGTGASGLEAGLARRLAGEGGSSAARSYTGAFLSGAAREGVDESLQSGVQQVAMNVPTPGVSWDNDVGLQATLGGVLGAAIGGPMGLATHKPAFNNPMDADSSRLAQSIAEGVGLTNPDGTLATGVSSSGKSFAQALSERSGTLVNPAEAEARLELLRRAWDNQLPSTVNQTPFPTSAVVPPSGVPIQDVIRQNTDGTQTQPVIPMTAADVNDIGVRQAEDALLSQHFVNWGDSYFNHNELATGGEPTEFTRDEALAYVRAVDGEQTVAQPAAPDSVVPDEFLATIPGMSLEALQQGQPPLDKAQADFLNLWLTQNAGRGLSGTLEQAVQPALDEQSALRELTNSDNVLPTVDVMPTPDAAADAVTVTEHTNPGAGRSTREQVEFAAGIGQPKTGKPMTAAEVDDLRQKELLDKYFGQNEDGSYYDLKAARDFGDYTPVSREKALEQIEAATPTWEKTVASIFGFKPASMRAKSAVEALNGLSEYAALLGKDATDVATLVNYVRSQQPDGALPTNRFVNKIIESDKWKELEAQHAEQPTTDAATQPAAAQPAAAQQTVSDAINAATSGTTAANPVSESGAVVEQRVGPDTQTASTPANGNLGDSGVVPLVASVRSAVDAAMQNTTLAPLDKDKSVRSAIIPLLQNATLAEVQAAKQHVVDLLSANPTAVGRSVMAQAQLILDDKLVELGGAKFNQTTSSDAAKPAVDIAKTAALVDKANAMFAAARSYHVVQHRGRRTRSTSIAGHP